MLTHAVRRTYGEYVATVDKIEKINRRAEKRGFTGRLTIEAEQVTVKNTNDIGFEVEEIFWDVLLTGEAPSYNGWTLAATLAWDEESGLIVRTAPGVEKVDRTHLKDGWCDHCQTNQHRANTYLVRNAAGEQHQVGSTCIKDFLGWSASVVFLSTDEVQNEIEDMFAGGGYYERRWSITTILAMAWAAIQAYGFKPASSFDGTTKDAVLAALDPRTRSDRELAAKLEPYVAKSAEQARIVRAWVLSDEFNGDNEYVRNLKAVAAADSASPRNIGLLVSAPQAWARAMERDLVRRAKREELVNEFIGMPKDKLELTVRIKSIRYIEGDYGTKTLYTLISDTKHVIKWFATNDILGETADDTVYKIRGTVKKHDEYNGLKSTVLTRCKIIK